MSEQKAPEAQKQGFFAALWRGIKRVAKAVWNAIKWTGKAIANAVHFTAKVVLAVVRFVGKVLSWVVSGIALILSTALLVVAGAVSIAVLVIYKIVQLVVLTLSTPALLIQSREAAKTDWSLYWLSWLPRNFTCMTLAEVALREAVREENHQQVFDDLPDNVHSLAEARAKREAQQAKGHPTPKQKRSHYRQRTAEARRAMQGNPATA